METIISKNSKQVQALLKTKFKWVLGIEMKNIIEAGGGSNGEHGQTD